MDVEPKADSGAGAGAGEEPPEARIAQLERRLDAAIAHLGLTEATCRTLTQVLEATSDAFVALDAEWRYIYVNQHAGRLFGRDPTSLLGKHIWTEFPEGIGQPFHQAYEVAAAERRPVQFEAYYPPYDRWFENRVFPHAGGLAIFFQDVTERRLAETRLRESEGRFRALVEQSLVGVYSMRGERYTYVNPCLCDMLGFTAEELYALPSAVALVHPDDRGFVAERLRRRAAGEMPPPSRFRMIRRDGAVIHVEAQGKAVTADGTTLVLGCQTDISDQVRTEAELRRNEARFRSMIEHAWDAITVVDQLGTIRYASPSYGRIFGFDPEERIGHGAFERVHPDDVARVVERFRALLATPGRTDGAEFRMRHGDGSWRHVMVVGQNLLDDPAVGGIVLNSRDVTARVRAEEALRASAASFRVLVEQSPEAIALHADGRILYVNSAGAALIGAPDPRALVGVPLTEIMLPAAPPPEGLSLAEAPAQDARRDEKAMYRLVRRGDGRVLDVEVTSVMTVYEGRPVVQSHVRDVTERLALEAQLVHQAFHDPLTGLANRVLFYDRTEHALARTGRGEHMAVVVLDVDDFKRVNDSLGHAAGDELLRAVASRLLEAARHSDTVARLGGDEFALLLEGIAHDDDVGAVLERVTMALQLPVTVGSREVAVSASLGVAHPHHGEGADELLRNADVAMYRAKTHGKGRFEIFAPEMHAAAMERLELEADLRTGILRDEFRLVFQPLVDLGTGRILGAEALVRWQHPTRGIVAPMTFIPIAEQTGLILPLGGWVLAEACRQARSWQLAHGDAAGRAPWVSVNISGRQLQEAAFANEVRAALEDSGLDPGGLVLEITESVLLHDADAALVKLRQLKALGIRLALDDFGTGYSSLSYLQRFPIDVLKMDKSFTDVMGGEMGAAGEPALPRAIVGLGRSLGMQTVAEGIEWAQQFSRLRQLGCDIGQGFLFAEPTGAAEFAALLSDRDSGLPTW